MTNDELLAREEIRHIMAVYNTAGDSIRKEEFGSVFTDDAELTTAQFSLCGKSEIMNRLFQRVSDERTNARRPKFVRHNLTTSKIVFESSERAKGRTYFQVNTDIGLDHFGVYNDEFRKENGAWKISRRTVKTEYMAENSYFR